LKRSALVLGLLAGFIWCSGQLLAQEISGVWQGILSGSVNERVVLTITKGTTGVLSSQFYSVDHALMLPSAATTFQASLLECSSPQGYSYEGTMSADGKAIAGTWRWNASSKGTALNFERATKEANWAIDTTPHKTSFVTVEPGVKVEVLDWGGTGRSLVLLTGLGDNAHVFDTFAPKLTSKYHVYGITRRGFGASDSPQAVWENYSADRLGDDVISVLDELELERPVLAGHSIAGEELSSIGSRHPERVAGLIYLDAGYGFAMYVARSRDSDIVDWDDMRNKVNAITDASTVQEQKVLVQEMLQTELPRYEQELKDRQKFLLELPDDPPLPQEKINSNSFRVSQALFNGEQRFTEIKCPILAFFREPLPAVAKPDSDAATKAQASRDADALKGIKNQAKAFGALGPNAHVVMLPGANHYIFRSNEADVLRDMNAFITTLP
jgi:pimeloyl-ACP methyl ester carboxylesterase